MYEIHKPEHAVPALALSMDDAIEMVYDNFPDEHHMIVIDPIGNEHRFDNPLTWLIRNGY